MWVYIKQVYWVSTETNYDSRIMVDEKLKRWAQIQLWLLSRFVHFTSPIFSHHEYNRNTLFYVGSLSDNFLLLVVFLSVQFSWHSYVKCRLHQNPVKQTSKTLFTHKGAKISKMDQLSQILHKNFNWLCPMTTLNEVCITTSNSLKFTTLSF